MAITRLRRPVNEELLAAYKTIVACKNARGPVGLKGEWTDRVIEHVSKRRIMIRPRGTDRHAGARSTMSDNDKVGMKEMEKHHFRMEQRS